MREVKGGGRGRTRSDRRAYVLETRGQGSERGAAEDGRAPTEERACEGAALLSVEGAATECRPYKDFSIASLAACALRWFNMARV